VFGEISVIVMPNPCLNATSTNPTPVGCSGTI
jgi:hypothetical protein